MTFPINEQEFVNMWLGAIGDPDSTDKDFAEALVSALNRAYNAGKRAGREEAAACRK